MSESSRSKNLSPLRGLRRELRKNGTPAEGALWNLLKDKQLNGLTWRRQYSVGDYILDFYCPKLHLAIELDGAPHYTIEGSISDLERDEWLLNNHQIEVIRIENKDVFEQYEQIRAYLLDIVTEKLGK